MKRWVKALSIGLALTFLISLCGFSYDCEEIRQQVLRLHVLANSDSEEDQQLKLKVRDAVIEKAAGIFDGIKEEDDAKTVAQEHLDELTRTAQQAVYDAGYEYPVSACLTKMYFETRAYDAGTMPAGMYDALRITIGKGEGKNWWCVAFPPLCVASATDNAATLSDVLTDSQQDIVEQPQKYEVRFKLVEWMEDIGNAIREWTA